MIQAYSSAQIKELYNKGFSIEFLFFWGHQPSSSEKITSSCLSQWYIENFSVDDKVYNCMEKFMMAQKARLFGDVASEKQIMNSNIPRDIKSMGRAVKNFKQTVWDNAKYDIVLQGNIAKFSQNKALKDFLISTNDKILVEASPYDIHWGIGMDRNNPQIYNPNLWRGTNLLGFALMQTRDILKN